MVIGGVVLGSDELLNSFLTLGEGGDDIDEWQAISPFLITSVSPPPVTDNVPLLPPLLLT